MQLRSTRPGCTLVALTLALALAACGGDGADGGTDAAGDTEPTGAPGDGPTITVGSFNFGESVTIAEIYAQAMEAEGYPVARALDLDARERIYEDLASGSIDLLPEYAGSALGVGFSGEPSADTDETVAGLREAFAELDVTVLEPSPAQDKNVFVVTAAFAEEHDVARLSDLAELDGLAFAGPPECETRATCLVGLQEVYGLDDLTFASIQETPRRVSLLRDGEIQLALMFSTDPPLQSDDLVALADDEGIIAAENVTPVLGDEIVEAYGDELVSLLDAVSAALTTEALIDMNTRVYVGGADPAAVARSWLEEHGFLDA